MSDTSSEAGLPILGEIGAALYAASVAADHRHGARTRVRLRGGGRWLRRPLVIVIVLVGASGSLGGLALAGTFSGGTISPQAWIDGQRVVPETTMTPDQTADLEILRRPRVASDALPAADVENLTNSPVAANGPNFDLSRQAQGFTTGAAYLIPGNGMICFVAQGGGTCQPDAIVNTGQVLMTGGSVQAPGMTSVAGIVPDGVTQVTLNIDGGGTVITPVHENVYMTSISGGLASVTFQGPNGPVTVNNN
ncbi:MAG: hypothetical protein ABSG64_07640 [Solirubrobacteraceae bacterium]|jgi:hypothetical protein